MIDPQPDPQPDPQADSRAIPDGPAGERKPTPEQKYDAWVAKDRARSKNRQQSYAGSTEGWTATGNILSGIIVWGLIGWGLKAWTGWVGFLPIGVLLGAALGVYMVTKQATNPPRLMDITKAQDHGASLWGTPDRPDERPSG